MRWVRRLIARRSERLAETPVQAPVTAKRRADDEHRTSSPVILITGASSGIGEATRACSRASPAPSLVLVARREERLRELAESLGDSAPASSPSTCSTRTRPRDPRPRARAPRTARPARQQRRRLLARALRRRRLREREAHDGHQLRRAVRLTEALLPLLRASAPSAIVNVASTAGRVARAGTGAYSASKFALAGWSDSLWAEEQRARRARRARAARVHLDRGLPAVELTEKPWTRWMVSTPEKAAEAIYEAGIGRRAERYVPRPYASPLRFASSPPASSAACSAAAQPRS